jgi:hypothetical protein
MPRLRFTALHCTDVFTLKQNFTPGLIEFYQSHKVMPHTTSHDIISHLIFHYVPLNYTPSYPIMPHPRNAKESVNDANDRAIRSASLYFKRMLEGTGNVVLITNDADNQVQFLWVGGCVCIYI